jgi:hypothetical protein
MKALQGSQEKIVRLQIVTDRQLFAHSQHLCDQALSSVRALSTQ